MADPVLRLVPRPGDPDSPRAAPACRVPGCAGPARGSLGFCAACAYRYAARRARRGRLVDALCATLAALGDPVFAAFGGRRREFGAHVLAHLEELEARAVHVPAAAVEDYVAELDARLRDGA